jgi:hypothetical protein
LDGFDESIVVRLILKLDNDVNQYRSFSARTKRPTDDDGDQIRR